MALASTVNAPVPCVAFPQTLVNAAPMLAKIIGENMKAARKARGLSLQKVAAKCVPPTSYQQLARLEKGDRSLSVDWVERVGKALGVDPMELISGREQPGLDLNEQVARDIAETLALVAREGDPPSAGTVEALSLMLQELTGTFLRHPQSYRDAEVARPVIDLASRRFAPAKH
jgi:transcriptional regulator with XRE-family HTH domain